MKALFALAVALMMSFGHAASADETSKSAEPAETKTEAPAPAADAADKDDAEDSEPGFRIPAADGDSKKKK